MKRRKGVLKMSMKKGISVTLACIMSVMLLNGCGDKGGTESVNGSTEITSGSTESENEGGQAVNEGTEATGEGAEATTGIVTISVGNWPSTEGASLDTRESQKKAFEEKYSEIKIEPDTWAFDLKTYYPKAAAGLLPTTYTCPFTESGKIIRSGYARTMTKALQEVGYDKLLNEKLMDIISKDGEIYYMPESCYALGIGYNVSIFEQAGLMNEDGTPKVPATWEDLLEMAKIIKEKTGKAGFAIPTSNNSGGWLFTPIAWSYGVDFMEQDENGKWKATFDTEECVKALQFVRDLKWENDVFPSNILIDNAEYQKLFATGQLGMIITGASITQPVSTYEMDPNDVGLFAMPAGPERRVSLLGGKIYTVSSGSTDEQVDAAVKWYEYVGVSPYISDAVASAQQQEIDTALAEGRAVGVEKMQIWNEDSEVVQNYNRLVEENANVNINHFKSYNESLADPSLEVQVEEPVCAQDLYGILDNCLQEVLNNENADCAALIKNAAEQFQTNFLDVYAEGN